MPTVLDIDLDFFVDSIAHGASADKRLPEWGYSAETGRVEGYFTDTIEEALAYLETHCLLPQRNKTPGAIFEHHDELFDFAVAHFTEPVHLIHVDAHADMGGDLNSSWEYHSTQYMHLPLHERRTPTRGNNYLNCGNFLVFLAACGLLEKVTFVTHPKWQIDYDCLYLKDFSSASGALQLKRFPPNTVRDANFHTVPHEKEDEIPFIQVSREDFFSIVQPDTVFLTRSPCFTPASADSIYDAIAQRIQTA